MPPDWRAYEIGHRDTLGKALRGPREKVTSEDINSANTLILNFQAPEPREINFCCVSHTDLRYFVMAALANSYNHFFFFLMAPYLFKYKDFHLIIWLLLHVNLLH